MEQDKNQVKTDLQLTKTSSSKNLLTKLTSGDKLGVSSHLSRFKERGLIKFEKVFEIDHADRIPALVNNENGRDEVLIALTASLKSLFSNFNLRVGLNEDQLIEIADLIIEQSFEDNLAIEDFLLFSQKFLVGDYGKIYDRMDVPTFFEFFEKYRQARHDAILNIREEQHAQFKAMGRDDRPVSNPVELDRDSDPKDILSLMQTFYDGKKEKE